MFTFSILLICLLATSCSQLGTESSEHGTNNLNNTSAQPSQQELTDSDNNEFEITSEIYSENNIRITYPQICNLHDGDKQERINDIIKEGAYGFLANLLDDDRASLNYDIEYKISFKNASILSIIYTGSDIGQNWYCDVFRATNIDIANEKILALTDLVDVNDDFIKLYREGKLVYPEAPEGKAVVLGLSVYTDEQWILRLSKIGKELTQDYYYLTQGSLGISVPIARASGWHAEIEISFTDLVDNLKVEIEM